MIPINLTDLFLFRDWKLEDFDATPLVCTAQDIVEYTKNNRIGPLFQAINKIPHEEEMIIDNYARDFIKNPNYKTFNITKNYR